MQWVFLFTRYLQAKSVELLSKISKAKIIVVVDPAQNVTSFNFNKNTLHLEGPNDQGDVSFCEMLKPVFIMV